MLVLHAARCYHRDIAPDNILVLDSGAPVLLDFGAARRIIGEGAQDVTVVLKPGYAPVEQYADDETIRQGPWTDVYAMSAVLRFAITGKAPPASVTRVVTDPVHPLVESVTGYSRDFLRAIDCGFAVRPEDRPQSIADYRQMLGIRTLAPSQPRSGAARPPAGKATASVAQDPPASAPEVSPPAAPTIAPEIPQPDPPAPAPAPFKLDSVTGSKPALQAPPPPAAPLVDVGTMPPPPKGIGRRGWLVVGGGTVLAAVAIVGFYLAMRPASDAPGVGAKADARAPAVESSAIRAQVAPDVEPSPPAAAVRAAEPTRADTSAPPRNAPTSPAVAVAKDAGGTKAAEGEAAPPAPAAARAPATPDAASPPPAAAPATGRMVLDIKPWGEVYVDGRKRGLSPPLKNLQLPEGRYRVEVRNPAAATIARDVEVKAGRSTTIAHTFK